jgi:hypothetical protein
MYGGSRRPIAGRVRQRFVMFQRAGWVERLVRHSSMSDSVRRSSQSERGRRKRYPSIASYGDDGFAGSTHPAVMRAEALSRKEGHVGAVAFSRTGDPATGVFSDAEVIRKFGDVPDDLSAL